MGRLARLLSFTRSDKNGAKVSVVKFDQGGGANKTGEHFCCPGDDAFPLETDFIHTDTQEETGGFRAIAYLDPISTKKAQAGDKRIYARDSSGNSVCEIWLKNDSSILITNGTGTFTLQPNGDFLINGVTIDTAGNITTPGIVTAAQVVAPSMLAAGKEIAGHKHLAGTPPGDTGTNK
jgi:hypothetical protein